MDMNIKEQGDVVSLHATLVLKPGDQRFKPIDAQKYLEQKGYEVGKCFNRTVLDNRDLEKDKTCTGSWTFELLKSPKKNVYKPLKREAKKKEAAKPNPSSETLVSSEGLEPKE
tara:strand:+ start:78 stop:416 length:339 start_codon:yes stop_codon:yes gene_type:complete